MRRYHLVNFKSLIFVGKFANRVYTSMEFALIPRPHNLTVVKIDLQFNCQSFEVIEIDLVHINKNGRSTHSKEAVIKIFHFD